VPAAADPLAGAGVLAGVDHLDVPLRRQRAGERGDRLGAEARRKHEPGGALPREHLEQVPQHRVLTGREQRLRDVGRERVRAGAAAAAEHDCRQTRHGAARYRPGQGVDRPDLQGQHGSGVAVPRPSGWGGATHGTCLWRKPVERGCVVHNPGLRAMSAFAR
jgi:hypothetical protein